jgi:hypothetical protein
MIGAFAAIEGTSATSRAFTSAGRLTPDAFGCDAIDGCQGIELSASAGFECFQ